MSFCNYSTTVKQSKNLTLNSLFITDYMPFASEQSVKVYLYGLNKCQNPDSLDNTIEDFAKNLNMTTEEVLISFEYWKKQGLVNIVNLDPIEVKYLEVIPLADQARVYDEKSYADFNNQMQEIITGRMITPTEYKEYYYLIESMHIDKLALILIAKYCTLTKGNDVNYPYIITLAKNWAYEGIKTAEQVDDKIKALDITTSYVKDLLLLGLGTKRNATYTDYNYYLKWTKEMGFSNDVILSVAKTLKRKGGIEKLNSKLTKYYDLKLLSEKEISDYETNKENLIKLASSINKKIGVYYENLENVIESYLTVWQNMGFDDETLLLIADFCFKNNIRSLSGMDTKVKSFYSLGLVTEKSINEYLGSVLKQDDNIKKLLVLCGLDRKVSSFDREFFSTWTNKWGFSQELIEYVCSLATNKFQPMQYINKILSTYREKNIFTIDDAKKYSLDLQSKFDVKPTSADNFVGRSYSKEDINALFDTLSEVKI